MSEQFARFLARRSVGDVVDGEVVAAMPFGAFVRVDDVDGFLPEKPAPAVGAPVRVRVVAIDAAQERFAVEPV
jgi:hypothetical protein